MILCCARRRTLRNIATFPKRRPQNRARIGVAGAGSEIDPLGAFRGARMALNPRLAGASRGVGQKLTHPLGWADLRGWDIRRFALCRTTESAHLRKGRRGACPYMDPVFPFVLFPFFPLRLFAFSPFRLFARFPPGETFRRPLLTEIGRVCYVGRLDLLSKTSEQTVEARWSRSLRIQHRWD